MLPTTENLIRIILQFSVGRVERERKIWNQWKVLLAIGIIETRDLSYYYWLHCEMMKDVRQERGFSEKIMVI